MKKIITCLVLLVSFVLSTNKIFASHTAGGELTYEKVPNTLNTYKFTFKFYRNCANNGSPASTEPTSFTMCYTSPCTGTIQSITLPKIVGNINTTPPVPNGSTLSNGCDSTITQCEVLTSAIPGYEQWWYSATLTLPSQCNDWRFWIDLCCRNNNIINLGGGTTSAGYDLYVETRFDNLTSPTAQNNSSPYFLNSNSSSSLPIPYMCINSPYFHNGGAFDPDGDSLYFEMISPRDGVACVATTAPNILIAGYNLLSTAGQPMDCANTFNLDPNTGYFSLTPNNIGKYALSMKCSEYRNGVLLGSIMRDMQVVVDNCVPMPVSTVIDSINIQNGVVNIDTVKTCPGTNLNFCFDVVSNNGVYIMQLFNNAASAFPGSSITFTKPNDSVLTVCMNWQSQLADTGMHVLFINVKDSINCLTNPGLVGIPIWVNNPIKAHNDTSICAGDIIPLWAYANNNFTWSVLPGGSPITTLSCLNCANPNVNPSVTTSYVVNDNVCNNKDTVVVSVAAGPGLTITPDTTTCVNSTLQLNVTANPSTQTYNYTWSPATGLSSTSVANPIVTGANMLGSTIYTVTVVPQGILACLSTATVNVDLLNGYNILNNDTTICDGDQVQIVSTGGNPKYTYSWTPTTFVATPNIINTTISPTPFGTYPYTFAASFPGCPDSIQTLNISVEPIPVVNAGIDREICKGDTVHMLGSVIPATGTYTYQWSPASDLNDGTIINPSFSGLGSTVFTLTATTPMGCKGQDQMVIDIISVDFMNLNGDRNLCPNTPTTLTAGGAIEYLWSPANMVSDSTSNVVTVNPISTTTFYVYGKDAKGCLDTLHATVVINPSAVVNLGDDKTIYPGESTQIYADGNCSYFTFFPPNGLSATNVKDPIAQPSVTTRYFVTARTEDGCETTDSVDVIVSPESLIEIPNAFSPGAGTSINDDLKIIVRGGATLNSYKIFNRWGEQVFSTSDISKGWNGQFNGKPQPMGAYIYVIDAVTTSGKRFYKQGNVTLIR